METPDNQPATETVETVESNIDQGEQPTTSENNQETTEELFSIGKEEEVQLRRGDEPVVCEFRPSLMKDDMPNILTVSLLTFRNVKT